MSSGADTKDKQKIRKPGTRDQILDAAEIEFATYGYKACSLRVIAQTNSINLGLIHYYFGGKEGLFSEVFLRRSKTLVNRRTELLDGAKRRHGDGPIPVVEIIHCFINPTVEMIKQGEGPRAYIRLQGLLRSDPPDFAGKLRCKLRGEAFNETNRKIIGELQRSCPHLTAASVVWRFSMMVGAYYSLITQSARVDELSDGLCVSTDIDAAIAEAVPFFVGGFDASLGVAADPRPTASPSASPQPPGTPMG